MARRHLRVLDGSGNSRGGDSHGVAVRRVLCTDCRFREIRLYGAPHGSGHFAPSDACMVNRQQKCAMHNPEGLCAKFESSTAALGELLRGILGIAFVGALVVGAVFLLLRFG